MPKLTDGEMTLSLEEATDPAILKGYGAEVTKRDDDTVTIKFPTMHHAASWANMAGLEAQTWPMGGVLSFKDWVHVDVMHPDS